MKILSVKSISFFFLLTLCSLTLQAQPGGGGDLYIKHFYDASRSHISPNSVDVEKHIILSDISNSPQILREAHYNKLLSFPKYYAFQVLTNHRSHILHTSKSEPHQRLMLVHLGDTMILNFQNLLLENPAGIFFTMDSICIQSAFVEIDFAAIQDADLDYSLNDSLKTYLRNGFTPHTLAFLAKHHWVKQQSLDEIKPLKQWFELDTGPDFFLEEAYVQIQLDQFDEAINRLRQIEKQNGNSNYLPYIQLGLYKAFLGLKELDSAWVHLKSYNQLSSDISYLSTLAELEIRLEQYDKAQSTYEKLVERSPNLKDSIRNLYTLLQFKNKYSPNHTYVEEKCNLFLNQIPQNHMKDKMGGDSEYYLLFLAYAELKLETGDLKAFENLMHLSIEYGFSHSPHKIEQKTFTLLDQLIEKHPQRSRLLELRANLRLKTMTYLGGNEGWNGYQMNLLKEDLKQMQRKHSFSQAYFYYQAQYEFRRKQYRPALKAINKAIKKNHTYPSLYKFRYYIRSKLEKTITPYQEDPDMITYNQKLALWEFPY